MPNFFERLNPFSKTNTGNERFNLVESQDMKDFQLERTHDKDQQILLARIDEALKGGNVGLYDAATVAAEVGADPFLVESLMSEAIENYGQVAHYVVDQIKARYEVNEIPGSSKLGQEALRELSRRQEILPFLSKLDLKYASAPLLAFVLAGLLNSAVVASGSEKSPPVKTFIESTLSSNEQAEAQPTAEFNLQVLSGKINVRSGPTTDASDVGDLVAGQIYTVTAGSNIVVDVAGKRLQGLLNDQTLQEIYAAIDKGLPDTEIWLEIGDKKWAAVYYDGALATLSAVKPESIAAGPGNQPETGGGLLSQQELTGVLNSLVNNEVFVNYPDFKPALAKVTQTEPSVITITFSKQEWQIRINDDGIPILYDLTAGNKPIATYVGTETVGGQEIEKWRLYLEATEVEGVPDWFGGFELSVKTDKGELVLLDTAQEAFYGEFIKVLAAQQQVSVAEMQQQLEENDGKVPFRTLKEAPGVLPNLEIYFPALQEGETVTLDLTQPISISSSDKPFGFKLNMAQSMETAKGLEPMWFSLGVTDKGGLDIRIMKPFADQLTDPTNALEAIKNGKIKQDDFDGGYRFYRGGSIAFILVKIFETYARINDLPPEGEVWDRSNVATSGAFLTEVWWGGYIDPDKRVFEPQIIDRERMRPRPKEGQKYPETGHITVKYVGIK
jgi:hypothetical protein